MLKSIKEKLSAVNVDKVVKNTMAVSAVVLAAVATVAVVASIISNKDGASLSSIDGDSVSDGFMSSFATNNYVSISDTDIDDIPMDVFNSVITVTDALTGSVSYAMEESAYCWCMDI